METPAIYQTNGHNKDLPSLQDSPDPDRDRRHAIILQLINAMKFGYLDTSHSHWEWPHVQDVLHRFYLERPLDHLLPDYNYVNPTDQEIRRALQVHGNINPRRQTLRRDDVMHQWPGLFPEPPENPEGCTCDGGPRHRWFCPVPDELGS